MISDEWFVIGDDRRQRKIEAEWGRDCAVQGLWALAEERRGRKKERAVLPRSASKSIGVEIRDGFGACWRESARA